jgi:hypothetical protein
MQSSTGFIRTEVLQKHQVSVINGARALILYHTFLLQEIIISVTKKITVVYL